MKLRLTPVEKSVTSSPDGRRAWLATTAITSPRQTPRADWLAGGEWQWVIYSWEISGRDGGNSLRRIERLGETGPESGQFSNPDHESLSPQPIPSLAPNWGPSSAEPSIELVLPAPSEPQVEPDSRAAVTWTPNSEPSRASSWSGSWANRAGHRVKSSRVLVLKLSPRAEKRNEPWVKPNNDPEPNRDELRAKPSRIPSPGHIKAVKVALNNSGGSKLCLAGFPC